MRTSIWYRTEEKNPDKSGYYLSYRGWGMGGKGDGDHDHGYLYYDKKKTSGASTNLWVTMLLSITGPMLILQDGLTKIRPASVLNGE